MRVPDKTPGQASLEPSCTQLIYTEDQIRAVRAAAKVIATLLPSDAGPPVKRLCGMFARYDWSPQEISQAAISAIKQNVDSRRAAR